MYTLRKAKGEEISKINGEMIKKIRVQVNAYAKYNLTCTLSHLDYDEVYDNREEIDQFTQVN